MKQMLKIILVLFILIQFITIDRTNPNYNKSLEIDTPKDIKILLKNACYDCHSNESVYPWYSWIAPLSWSIQRHIKVGRQWVNFSIWKSYTAKERQKKVREIYKAVYSAMPLSSYTMIHKNAKLSKNDRIKL